MLKFEPERGFGIYIHWPYCAKICPYCDFNVYAAKNREIEPLFQAIRDDLKGWRKKTGPRKVDTVFLGGGTPSLLPPEMVGALLEDIASLWGLHCNAEITLEANPDDLKHFAGMADVGVNRLSLGVQSLNDDALSFLGRNHSASLAKDAIKEGRERFKSLSLDFIYALPAQTMEDWKKDLAKIVNLSADHLSLYELTIEQRTAFGKAVARGAWQPANEDIAADLYELTQSELANAGYPAYEVSNHSQNEMHQAKHNIIYWQSGDWIGVGPGAHGRVTIDGIRSETVAEKRPETYISTVKTNFIGAVSINALSIEDVANERLMMGLRMVSGMPMADYEQLLGQKLNRDVLNSFVTDGLMAIDGDQIMLTQTGRLLADHISHQLALG